MKKFFKSKIFACLAIALMPLLLFTACDPIQYYTVEVLQTESNRGTAHGPNKEQQIAEGQEVELSATNAEGEFICWIKDSNKVVSTQPQYKFIVNANTAGKYTGLFTQSDPSLMLYTALTKAEVHIANITNFNVTVTITPADTITDVRRELFSGVVANQETNIYNQNVFSLIDSFQFLVSVHVEYYLNETSPESMDIENLQFDANNFTQEGLKIQDDTDNPIIILTFEKLSKSIVGTEN